MMVQVSANSQRAERVLLAVFLATAAYAILGFLLNFGSVELPEIFVSSKYEGNATGTFVNRNSYATYLGFGILTGMAVITRRMRALRSKFDGVELGILEYADVKMVAYASLVALMLVTLISTNSRMGVAAFLTAAFIFLLVLAIKRSKVEMWKVGAGAAFLGLIAGTGFYLYGATLLERLGSVENDADVRMALYVQVWDMILAKPLTGFGGDSFELAFQRFHTLPVSPDLVWDKAHNTYLTNWAEYGLVIGSIPMVIALLIFAKLLRTAFSRQRGFVVPLLGACVILQAALHSLVDFSLEIQANMFLFLAILALAWADALNGKAKKGQ